MYRWRLCALVWMWSCVGESVCASAQVCLRAPVLSGGGGGGVCCACAVLAVGWWLGGVCVSVCGCAVRLDVCAYARADVHRRGCVCACP